MQNLSKKRLPLCTAPFFELNERTLRRLGAQAYDEIMARAEPLESAAFTAKPLPPGALDGNSGHSARLPTFRNDEPQAPVFRLGRGPEVDCERARAGHGPLAQC